MPTYEYRCEACGTEFERFQPITAPPVKVCPSCRKSKVKRLISAGAGLIFKGSGFYITDYRSDGYKKAASSDSSEKSTTTSSTTPNKSPTSNNNTDSSTSGASSSNAPSKPQPAPAAKAKK